MICKTFEIRDSMTFIPAMGIQLLPACMGDRALIARAGYGVSPSEQGEHIVLVRLSDCKAANDPYDWSDRTMKAAHNHIINNWDSLSSGDLIDVEFILGEKPEPCQSEL